MTIQVFYTCVECALSKIAIDVPARRGEDVTEWMRQTIDCIATDHHVRSPECQATTISEIAIPIGSTDFAVAQWLKDRRN